MNKQIQIFKPGKHTAMSGAALSFSESDLIATAKAYDPKLHEAPLVIGHPQTDNPAYGWVGKLAFTEGALEINPVQLNPDFSEMVKSGAFKKISAAFYSPDSPANPTPGVYYLRHVGFLGAQPPAVKGLRAPEFAASEEGVLEFDLSPEFNEQPNKGDIMTEEEKARLAALEAENAKLKSDYAALFAENETLKQTAVEFAEAHAKSKKAALHAEHVVFAEGLIKAGKMLPVEKNQTVAMMDNLAAQELFVEFGEGSDKKTVAPLALYRAQLESMPVRVEFAEFAGDKGVNDADADDAVAVAAKAREFQQSEAKAGRSINIAQAVQHITKVNGGK